MLNTTQKKTSMLSASHFGVMDHHRGGTRLVVSWTFEEISSGADVSILLRLFAIGRSKQNEVELQKRSEKNISAGEITGKAGGVALLQDPVSHGTIMSVSSSARVTVVVVVEEEFAPIASTSGMTLKKLSSESSSEKHKREKKKLVILKSMAKTVENECCVVSDGENMMDESSQHRDMMHKISRSKDGDGGDININNIKK